VDMGGLVELIELLLVGGLIAAAIASLIAAIVGSKHAGRVTPYRIIPGALFGTIATTTIAIALIYHLNDLAAIWPAYPIGCAVAYCIARWVKVADPPSTH
jgi:hypothetical protein